MTIDWLFPTHCQACAAATNLRSLCQECWLESSLADPSHRCRTCFAEIDAPELCARCHRNRPPFQRAFLFERTAPIVPLLYREDAIEAAAGFALHQFLALNWEKPHFIAPVPAKKHPIATFLAHLLQVPCRQIFRRRIWPLGREHWELKEDQVGDHSIVLLFDVGSTPRQLRSASRALASAFPEKGYILSIYG